MTNVKQKYDFLHNVVSGSSGLELYIIHQKDPMMDVLKFKRYISTMSSARIKKMKKNILKKEFESHHLC